MKLLIATTNPGKVREFREMLGGDRILWSDLSTHPAIEPVEETGKTFRANACLKAIYYARLLNTWTIADDSGLEVDALGGAPGVYRARWALLNSAGQGDGDNNACLLRQLQDIPTDRRTARFVCVLALSDPSGIIILTSRDTVEGRIIHEPRGDNGFGYDPLFFIDSLGKTTAELPPERKHQISHRGKALARMKKSMSSLPMLE